MGYNVPKTRVSIGQIDSTGFLFLFTPLVKPAAKAVSRAAKKGKLGKDVQKLAESGLKGGLKGVEQGVRTRKPQAGAISGDPTTGAAHSFIGRIVRMPDFADQRPTAQAWEGASKGTWVQFDVVPEQRNLVTPLVAEASAAAQRQGIFAVFLDSGFMNSPDWWTYTFIFTPADQVESMMEEAGRYGKARVI